MCLGDRVHGKAKQAEKGWQWIWEEKRQVTGKLTKATVIQCFNLCQSGRWKMTSQCVFIFHFFWMSFHVFTSHLDFLCVCVCVCVWTADIFCLFFFGMLVSFYTSVKWASVYSRNCKYIFPHIWIGTWWYTTLKNIFSSISGLLGLLSLISCDFIL